MRAKLIVNPTSGPRDVRRELPAVLQHLEAHGWQTEVHYTERRGEATELAAKAGYDPRAAVTLWQKMAKAGGSRPPEFLSTHPSPENREKRLAELAPQMMPYYEKKGPRPVYNL